MHPSLLYFLLKKLEKDSAATHIIIITDSMKWEGQLPHCPVVGDTTQSSYWMVLQIIFGWIIAFYLV